MISKEVILKNLINGGFISDGTKLLVTCLSDMCFSMPTVITKLVKVVKVVFNSDSLKFVVTDLDAQKIFIIDSEQVDEIDGMTFNRMIRAYSLNEDGSRKAKKRRKKSELIKHVAEKYFQTSN